MAKSLVLTYLCWFIGGAFGLHHVYLGRFKQAFLYWCLPGGYFGAGWFRDLWRIPEYVREANNDPGYVENLKQKMREYDSPPFKVVRFLAMTVASNLFSTLVLIALPTPKDELGPGLDFRLLVKFLAPVASAIGIWTVGNIGREQGPIKWPLAGCLLAAPFHFGVFGDGLRINYTIVTLSGIILFHWKSKSWRKTLDKPMPTWKRFLLLFLCCGLYSSLWCSYLYFNLKIVTKDGDEIRFRDAVGNFVKSPAFQSFASNVADLWRHALDEGFYSAWEKLIISLDPLGETHALKVLDLKKGTSQSEIKARYRELTKKWHPDKVKDETEKEEAHKRFMEIQQAYETLSDIKTKRATINSKQQNANQDEQQTNHEEL